ncbi:MAG: SPOR domain-containing protein [Melioribacteraceae bacterium]|nr:SPOR domain-containing protein [Melioribacteraceae bacterium]MCF8355791.1 SPOR domain-containing protein [Melioribacteraceae bacterium]MCF8392819.1 SPOR domain-containing protein [Melioribacteraceae bacterium]MCF8418695.1 SPOR domain-containing protein [Melioribacteraceae bacterium]
MRSFIFFFLISISIAAQEANIVPYLKMIEGGEISEAEENLNRLKAESPNDPSVIFLDAVLTKDGEAALTKYNTVYTKFPKSNYADASLYRVFSYYYSLGIYNKAQSYLDQLKNNYPGSPYIKMADRSIPDLIESAPAVTNSEPVNVQLPPVNSEKKYEYTIQAGAFLNHKNAETLLNKLNKAGYPAAMHSKDVGGSILKVVTFGKFKSEIEAQPLLDYLKNVHNLNGRVVPSN